MLTRTTLGGSSPPGATPAGLWPVSIHELAALQPWSPRLAMSWGKPLVERLHHNHQVPHLPPDAGWKDHHLIAEVPLQTRSAPVRP